MAVLFVVLEPNCCKYSFLGSKITKSDIRLLMIGNFDFVIKNAAMTLISALRLLNQRSKFEEN